MNRETIEIMKKFEGFTDGVRLLMLTKRVKEGGKFNRPDWNAKRIVSKNKEDFEEILDLLLDVKDTDYRIYSSVNTRDIEKGIRKFKIEQLEADYYCEKDRHKFYYDIKNRWISALMQPSCRSGKNFLIDIDEGDDDEKAIEKQIKKKGIVTVLRYDTKNGRHIITEPFNPALLPGVEIKKDALLLLSF